MAYTKYSLTPANNTATPPDGAPEGMLPSAVNDTMRDMMAQIRDCGDGIRDGTYTMTAPKITGGTITGAAFTGNTFTSPVISGGSINNTPIGATTANSGAFTTLSASGVATISAGTVSAPALTTTGDTNTGIFFPAADTIAFTEGGVESMRIDSSGNVGIGTSSPATILNAYNATSAIISVDGDAVTQFRASRYSTDVLQPQLVLRKARGTLASPSAVNSGDLSGGLFCQAYGGTNFRNIARIDGIVQTYTSDTNIAGSLIFYTNGGSTDVTERMRIDSSGNVGIGTSSPTQRLHVVGNSQVVPSTSTGAVWMRANNASDNFYLGIDNSVGDGFTGTAYGRFLYSNGAYPIIIYTNNTERMRIDSSGNVSIGTTTPGYLGNPADLCQIAVNRLPSSGVITNSARSAAFINLDGSSGGSSIQFATAAANNTNPTERMRITSGGNVLIGTSSKLSGGVSGLDINNSVESGITFGWSGTSEAYFYLASATIHRWETASGTTIQVSSGNSAGVSLANGGTSWGSLSDERKKDIIEPITNASEKVATLRTVIGKYKTDEEDRRRAFLIAQDVEKVLPEAVVTDGEGDLILQYTETIPLLVAAIKEQQAMIEELKQEVALLKAK